MTLTDEDREVLTIEREIRVIWQEVDAWRCKRRGVKGAETRLSLHPKSSRLRRLQDRRRQLIYGADGNFRDDLRHLLDGKKLDVALLDDAPEQEELF